MHVPPGKCVSVHVVCLLPCVIVAMCLAVLLCVHPLALLHGFMKQPTPCQLPTLPIDFKQVVYVEPNFAHASRPRVSPWERYTQRPWLHTETSSSPQNKSISPVSEKREDTVIISERYA